MPSSTDDRYEFNLIDKFYTCRHTKGKLSVRSNIITNCFDCSVDDAPTLNVLYDAEKKMTKLQLPVGIRELYTVVIIGGTGYGSASGAWWIEDGVNFYCRHWDPSKGFVLSAEVETWEERARRLLCHG
jgi:hypothetical protein